MTAVIKKSKAGGSVRAPSSKSMAHRLLICAALAKGESEITNVTYSEDILATIDCLKKMGSEMKPDKDTVHVKGIENIFDVPESDFFCRESGSTLRFLLPLLLLNGNKQHFTGAGLLMKRPMSVYEQICKDHGLHYRQTPDAIEIKGNTFGRRLHRTGQYQQSVCKRLAVHAAVFENGKPDKADSSGRKPQLYQYDG